jgi:hypothetical protein
VDQAWLPTRQVMKRALLIVFLMIVPQLVSAQSTDEAQIIQILKSLRLTGSHQSGDYVMSLGSDQGLHVGSVVDVYRRQPISRSTEASTDTDLRVWLGQIEIFHVEARLSVGRLKGVADPKTNPMLDYPLPMIGDSVELGVARRAASRQRVPGLIRVSENRLSSDAHRYVKKVAAFIRKNHVTSVHFVASTPTSASPVKAELQGLLKRSPAGMQVHFDGSIPKHYVGIVLESTPSP